mmetsp:Transcript_30474/g.85303  ORF Transcript_30474/g.85303 Transcript_30474/m.85303 type:complete len:216 (-) Transcript_30474:86-733(-)|eukprot:CAMPEP_0119121948 /NCGR_PEP_ID=MMETSP1310-20130426/2355_1 /TAXON_ID=464262 /ORGANISM="Genus nov. species nov., Strain RCC2339" /LENGTH=215 /DNA_ID=CAMNT_0007111545 /DNA_START=75 /DNA_END=722 /DNA_ORIENTATION=+
MMEKKMIVMALVALMVGQTVATYGVDISQAVSSSSFSCMVGEGFIFAIPRGYRSNGSVDPNIVSNIDNARSGGMSYVDTYLFPCVPCGNPAGQMDALVDAISGSNYGMIWIDVENYAWSSSLSSNQNFIADMIDEGLSRGQSLGIYSNYYNWQSIVGLDWSYPADQGLPLWYAHYDNNPSFSDFTPFGGWSSPNIKQYAGDVTVCGVGVDKNWYP